MKKAILISFSILILLLTSCGRDTIIISNTKTKFDLPNSSLEIIEVTEFNGIKNPTLQGIRSNNNLGAGFKGRLTIYSDDSLATPGAYFYFRNLDDENLGYFQFRKSDNTLNFQSFKSVNFYENVTAPYINSEYLSNNKKGVTSSGTSCIITEITGGIITGATCT
jgi:hypothetical protein